MVALMLPFTGPTFSGGVFGDGVGGAVRKEDNDILEMWNSAISEMSKDGTTGRNNKKMVWKRHINVITKISNKKSGFYKPLFLFCIN